LCAAHWWKFVIAIWTNGHLASQKKMNRFYNTDKE
jgi:hypothetical protein